jgi:hypothetical protein
MNGILVIFLREYLLEKFFGFVVYFGGINNLIVFFLPHYLLYFIYLIFNYKKKTSLNLFFCLKLVVTYQFLFLIYYFFKFNMLKILLKNYYFLLTKFSDFFFSLKILNNLNY